MQYLIAKIEGLFEEPKQLFDFLHAVEELAKVHLISPKLSYTDGSVSRFIDPAILAKKLTSFEAFKPMPSLELTE